MARSHLENDLKTIARDASTSIANPGDNQTANRLNLDVTNFLHEHGTPADRQSSIKTLHSAGIHDDQMTTLGKLGFPKPVISDASKTQREFTPAAQNSMPDERLTPLMSATDVVSGVTQAEGNFNQTALRQGETPAQEALRAALHNVDNYCTKHPDQASQIVADLAQRGHLPQLAIAKLDEKTRNMAINDTLTRAQAVAILDDGTPLGKALAKSMDRSFAPTQKDGTTPSSYWGRGFADNIDGRTKEPNMSMRHLRMDLMTHFDSAPLKPNHSDSLLDRLLSFF